VPSPRTQRANGNGTPHTGPTQLAFQFTNADVNDVLRYLSEKSGLVINPEVPVTGRVTITSMKAVVTPDEAINELNVQLRPLNVVAVRNERQLRLISRDKAKKTAPVYSGSDPTAIPDTEELRTQVMPVRNIEAVRLRQDLASIIPIDADVAANSGSNSLVVTDSASNIRRLAQIISALDKGSSASLKTYLLKNATATSAATLVNNVFKPDPNANRGRSSGDPRQGGDPRDPRSQGGGGVDAALREGRVNAVADERTNTLVVTGPVDTLDLVTQIVEKLDENTVAQLELKVFTLKFGDAASAAALITSVFTPSAASTGRQSSEGGESERRRSEREGQASVDAALRGGRVNAVADVRTNSVIVTAPTAAITLIQDMIDKLEESPLSEQAFFIYPLRNAQSANLEFVLNNIFGNGTTGTGGVGGRTTGTNRTTGARGGAATGATGGFGTATAGAGGTGIGRTRGTTTVGGGNQFGQFGFAGGFGGAQLSQNAQRVANELSGQVFVVADPDTNSLLVTVASRYAEPVKTIISELDRPVPQVLIKVLVAEVTHDDGVDFGVDFTFTNRRANGDGTTIGGNFGNASLTNGLVVGLLEDKVNATLHALATRGKLDVLSRPYILASDNQLASITVGQEVPFITNTRITDNGQQINTIQYQDVGIILNVTPRINPDGLVIMDVIPEISQLTGTTVPISDGVSAPVIAKRSAESRVGVRSGQTIVIGGLMEDRKTVTVSKIPLLGDIPVLGNIFARTQVNKSKTELLIFLTPHVAQQPDLLQGATDAVRGGLQITPQAVSPGKFDETVDSEQQRGAMPVTRPANPKEVSKTIPLPPRPRTPAQGIDPLGPQQQGPVQPGGFQPALPPQ
jgi:general secretion pathway protein D